MVEQAPCGRELTLDTFGGTFKRPIAYVEQRVTAQSLNGVARAAKVAWDLPDPLSFARSDTGRAQEHQGTHSNNN